VSKTSLGALFLIMGLVMLALLTFIVSLPSGLQITAVFLLGVVPFFVGSAMMWYGYRSGSRGKDSGEARLVGIKEQIFWKAMAQEGRITAAEAAAHAGQPLMEVEHALMSLVSEGSAVVEPSESGDVVYRVQSPLGEA
jgi:hypothetical protein